MGGASVKPGGGEDHATPAARPAPRDEVRDIAARMTASSGEPSDRADAGTGTFAVVLVGVCALLAITSLVTMTIGMLVDDAMWWLNASWAAAGLFAMFAAWRAVGGTNGAWRRAWIVLTAASAVWLAGLAAWIYYAATSFPQSPNVADALWYLFGGLSAAAMYVLLAPAGRRRGFSWTETALLVVAVSAAVVAALDPTLDVSSLPTAGRVAADAYAVIFVCVPVILAQAILVGPVMMRRRRDVQLLFVGMLIEAAAFTIWTPELLKGTYVTGGSPADPLWSVGMLVIGAAAVTARRDDLRSTVADMAPGAKRGVLPSIAFFILLAMLLVGVGNARDDSRVILLLGLTAVGVSLIGELFTILRAQSRLLDRERASHGELVRARASTDRFFEISRDVMAILDADRRIEKINPAWNRILGLDTEEVIGRRLIEFTHADDVERTEEIAIRMARGEPVTDFSNRFRGADGTWHWFTWQAVFDEADGKIYARATDTTESRRMSRLLAELNDELAERAAELERSNSDLQQFASIASHELREPLRTVAGFAGLIERRYRGQLDERAEGYIDFILGGVNRMNDLIEALLTFSRVGQQTAERVDVDTRALVRSVLKDMASIVESSEARITVGSLPIIQGDAHLITWVFQNLISNAIKYCDADHPEIAIEGVETQDAWRFSVTDNGIGVDPAHADRIFSIFQRLHGRDEYSGTGIGLAVCKRAVDLHGGTIWVEPVESGGSRFVFEIPFPADKGEDAE